MKKSYKIAIAILFAIIFFAVMLPEPKSTKDNSGEIKTNTSQSVDLVNISTEEIESRFNQFAKMQGMDLKLENVEPKYGDMFGSYEIHFKDGLVFGAQLEKEDGKAKYIYTIVENDEATLDSSRGVFLFNALVAVCDPTLSDSNRIQLLNSLGLEDWTVKNKTIDTQVVCNGIVYKVVGNLANSNWVKLEAFKK